MNINHPVTGNITSEDASKLLFKSMKNITNNIEEVLQRPVVKSGNGAIVYIPKKHIGKTVQITIRRN